MASVEGRASVDNAGQERPKIAAGIADRKVNVRESRGDLDR